MDTVERRIVPEVQTYMAQIKECPYEPELPNVPSSEWKLSSVKVLGDLHFIPGRDGRSLLIGTLKTVNGKDQWQRLNPESLSPSLVMAAKLSLGLQPRLAEPQVQTTPVRPKERKTETPKTPERRTERVAPGTEKTPEKVLEALRGISVSADGRDVPVSFDASMSSPSGLQSLLRKNGISASRYPTYVKNMNDHARILSDALSGKNPNGVSFDGLKFSVRDGSRTLFTTATRVLVRDQSGNISTLIGNSANFRDLPNGFEITLNGHREVHREDGSIQMAQEGGTQQFFDGDNRTPLMELRNGETFIVAASGERVPMKPRGALRNFSEAATWGRQIAQKLKTPEAIGAFVSQFYYGQDYNESAERSNWRGNQIQNQSSAIRYQPEGRGQQDVKHWQRTMLDRSGDCEDFALLAQGLLEQAGINSFAMLVTPLHYESVYFEPAGNDESGRPTYFACTVGLMGFKRSTKAYAQLGQAVNSLWDPQGSRASSPATFVYKGGPDGAIIHDQPKNPSDTKGEVYMAEYAAEEAYFRQFIKN
ncbi:MAG: hypothetical protein KBC47_02290 [Candidatus Peribacteraceae bacterium]|nr:hypothetical protein [Candidatus Peribacteraceae bacterium]